MVKLLMKTTLDLPDDLFRDVKLRAVAQGRTLRDVVADFLRQGLGQAPVGASPAALPVASSRVEVSAGGLPVIRCQPQTNASPMSLNDLLALEQQALAALDLQNARPPV